MWQRRGGCSTEMGGQSIRRQGPWRGCGELDAALSETSKHELEYLEALAVPLRHGHVHRVARRAEFEMGDGRGEIQVGLVPHAGRVAELAPAHGDRVAVVPRPSRDDDAAVFRDGELDGEPRDDGRCLQSRQVCR